MTVELLPQVLANLLRRRLGGVDQPVGVVGKAQDSCRWEVGSKKMFEKVRSRPLSVSWLAFPGVVGVCAQAVHGHDPMYNMRSRIHTLIFELLSLEIRLRRFIYGRDTARASILTTTLNSSRQRVDCNEYSDSANCPESSSNYKRNTSNSAHLQSV